MAYIVIDKKNNNKILFFSNLTKIKIYTKLKNLDYIFSRKKLFDFENLEYKIIKENKNENNNITD